MSRIKFTEDKVFPDRLRRLIKKELNISQVKFCNKIGISQGYLSMVLSGERGPSAELIAGIYYHYSEYLNWLLTGEGEMSLDTSTSTEPLVLDIEVLTKVIKGVEEYLRAGDKDLEPDKKGRLISLLYERFIISGDEPDPKTIVSYLKLVT